MKRQPTLQDAFPSLRQILKRFWPHICRQRNIIIGATVAMVAEVALRLLEPWPLKFVFDFVLMNSSQAGTSTAPGGMSPMTLLAVCAIALVLIVSARAFSSYMNRVGFALAGNRLLTECRGELFSHLQRLSLSYHSKKKTGEIVTRITGDIGRLKEIAVTAALPLMVHLVMLISMLGVMFWMDWRLSLVTLFIFPLFALTTRRISGRIRKVARKQRMREGEIGATAAEAISAIKTVQSLSLEEIQNRKFTAKNKASLKEGVQGKRLTAKLNSIVDILIAVATSFVLWFGAQRVVNGALTPGELIVFLAYLKGAFRPIRDLAKYAGRIAKGAASAERIMEVLDTTPAIVDVPKAINTPPLITHISFDNVTFSYEQNRPALTGVSFTVQQGQVVALAGPSGAGKSSVINLLLRLYDPDSGSVRFEGRDIRDYKINSVRRSISLVPQDNVLFGVSIRENIACTALDATEEDIIAAAKLARAHDFIMELPDGYDTVLAERGSTLSEGQRQRIAIARAAVRSAPILVFDEPTASLDNENTVLISDAIHDLAKNRITIIVAHDLWTVEQADMILYFEDGQIREYGSHAELLESGGEYARMYGLRITSSSGVSHA